MRTLARVAATLALAVLMAVGVTGVAWATFTGSSSSPVNVSTLLLQPPTNVGRTSCADGAGKTRTLGVGFTASSSVQVVNARPPSSPAKVLTYDVTVVNTGGRDMTTLTLDATRTGFTVNQDVGNGKGAEDWTVTIVTRYTGWTSTAVVRVLRC